jgi:murein DD-endopeptidase MepM/ murein hydrolase activator NlpD
VTRDERSPVFSQHPGGLRGKLAHLHPLLLGSAAVALSMAIGFQSATRIYRGGDSALERPAKALAPVVAAAPTPADPIKKLAIEVFPGDTLESIFRDNGLSLVDLVQILDVEVARKNLRMLRPGDEIKIRLENQQLLEISKDIGITESLVVQRHGEGFKGELVRLPVERRTVTAAARISRSLFEAASEARISENLIMRLADIFAWDIDFVRDIGAGDEFSIVYEELWRNGEKLGEGNILAAEFTSRGGRYTAIRFEEPDGRASYFTHDGRPMRKSFVRAPLAFTRISSGFNPNRRHPLLNTIRAHQGVDYAAPTGTPVKASGDGKIIFRGWKSGYGNTVILQHGGNVTTVYGHLSRFAKTSGYGRRVRQGEVIAYVGATGLATGPHLHYEYRKNGVALNPQTVILPPPEPLRGSQLTAFQATARPLMARLESRETRLAANRPTTRPTP